MCIQKYNFWPKNYGEKWSRKIYFEILLFGNMVIFITEDFGHFYGSSYVAAPDGSRTPVCDMSYTTYLACIQTGKCQKMFFFVFHRACLVFVMDCWSPSWI